MKKMKTVFKVDRNNGHVAFNEVVEGNEWVLNGEGVATIKFDGTSCMFKDGVLFKRFDRKVKKEFKRFIGTDKLTNDMFKEAPEGFIPCEENPDPKTGHWPGWVPINENDKWHIEGLKNTPDMSNGTFELVGPKVNGNKEKLDTHVLIRHGSRTVDDLVNRDFETIKEWLSKNFVEGIVFHHPDGRMAKIRRKDVSLDW